MEAEKGVPPTSFGLFLPLINVVIDTVFNYQLVVNIKIASKHQISINNIISPID